jgi:hypothetical protein
MRDSSNEPNDPLRSDWKARRRNGVAPWIAMAVGALLSLGAFVALRQDQNARLALELGHRTTNLKAFFQTRVSELTTASALRGLGRIGGRLVEFDFDFEAALSDFDTLAVAYGGLTYEVEWVPRIESSERADFESETQAEGIEDFQIWEFGPDGERRRASSRPEHFPIRFAAFGTSPRHPNLGFDLASSPIHRRALELARASSSMAVVARIPSEARFSESVELRYLLPIRNDASADKVGPTGEGELIGFVAWSTHMALRDIAIEPMPNAPNARLQQYLESMSELMVAHLARTAGGIEAVLLQTEAVESPESPAGAAARPLRGPRRIPRRRELRGCPAALETRRFRPTGALARPSSALALGRLDRRAAGLRAAGPLDRSVEESIRTHRAAR